jgi:hypothetical protein
MSLTYKLLKDFDGVARGAVQIDRDGIISTIPNAPDNIDWIEYQAWLAADPGNQPLPVD